MDLDTVREVVVARERADLAALTGDAAVLAGGTWLYSEPQERIGRLVDITMLGWPALTVTDAELEIAATCTLDELDTAVLPPEWSAAELFPQACRALLASHKIRRTATVGGNVCLGLPAGAVLAALTALDATLLIWGEGGRDRRIPVAHFVLGPGRVELRPGEVVRSIHLTSAKMRSRTAFRKIALAPLGRSGSVVMGRADIDGRCAITVSAATMRPVVLEFADMPTPGELTATIMGLAREVWYDDPHGTPAWRRHVSTVLAGDVLADLREVRS
ncbi:FAD binding domain-containing protein [Nocardia sp. NPDC051570]|uniref:FAD binding domain-containing protein n=1 Tax=Nocardia sp. NPDC051570 TaxID=3364324 RepID=UPI0037A1C8F7